MPRSGAEGRALQRKSGPPGRGRPNLDVRGDRRDIAALQPVLARVAKVLLSDATVSIRGDRHGQGTRRVRDPSGGRHVAPSVREHELRAAVPRELIASELFGHEKGRSPVQRSGAWVVSSWPMAGRSPDEVGDLPMETQVALLPRAAGARVRASRRERIGSRRRARHRRHEPRPPGGRSRRARSAAISRSPERVRRCRRSVSG